MLTAANVIGSPSSAARPAPASISQRTGLLAGFAFALLVADVFVTVSRFLEILQSSIGIYVPYLGTALHLITFVAALLSGAVLRAALSSTSIFLTLFTLWMLLCTPFSTWRGGSVQLMVHEWLPSFMGFLAVGAAVSILQCRKIALTFAVSVALIALLSMPLGGLKYERLSFSRGTLNNANDLAMVLLMGLPFFLVAGLTSKPRNRVMAFLFGLLVIAISLRTGSRGGLLSLLAMVGILFLTRSAGGKAKLAVAIGALGAILLLTAPTYSLERYKTIFSDPKTVSDLSSEEYQSSLLRKQVLQDSVRITLENPLFGVGPGVFAVHMANEAKRNGKWANWLVSHNAYTQVSSEMGFPGLFFYLAAIVSAWVSVIGIWRDRRQSPLIRSIALSVICSLTGLGVAFLFAADAYVPWLPVVMGLAVALKMAVKDSARRELQPISAVAPAYSPNPWIAASRVAPIPVLAGVAPIPAKVQSGPAPKYRFLGRPLRNPKRRSD